MTSSNSNLAAKIEAIQYSNVVSFADAYLPSDACLKLLESLVSNESLEVLELRGNDLSERATDALIHLVRTSPRLHRLGLEWTSVGLNSSFGSLLDCIGMNSTLKELDLKNCKISRDSSKRLAAMIRSNRSLIRVDLRWNDIGRDGGRLLAEAVRQNAHLVELQTIGNGIDVTDLKSIIASIERNQEESFVELNVVDPIPILLEEQRHNKAGLDELTAQKDQFKSGLEDAQKRLFDVEKAFEEYKKSAQQEVLRLEEENKKLSNEVKTAIAGRKVAEQEFELIREQLKKMNDEMKINSQEYNDAIGRAELRNTMDAEQRAHLKNELTALHAELEEQRERYLFDLQAAHDKLKTEIELREKEKEAAARMLLEKDQRYESDLEKTRQDAGSQVAQAEKRAKVMEARQASLQTEVNRLRQQLVTIQIEHEEQFAKFEAQVRSENEREFQARLAVIEERLEQVHNARDSLKAEGTALEKEYEKMMQTAEQERKEYEQWLRNEKQARQAAESKARTLETEVDHLRAVVSQKDHRIQAEEGRVRELDNQRESLRADHEAATQQMITAHAQELRAAQQRSHTLEQKLIVTLQQLRAAEITIKQLKEDRNRKQKGLHTALDGLKMALEESPWIENLPIKIKKTKKVERTSSGEKTLNSKQSDALNSDGQSKRKRKENSPKPELAANEQLSYKEKQASPDSQKPILAV